MNQRKLFIYISSLLFAIFLSINVHGNDNIKINGNENVTGDGNTTDNRSQVCQDSSTCIFEGNQDNLVSPDPPDELQQKCRDGSFPEKTTLIPTKEEYYETESIAVKFADACPGKTSLVIKLENSPTTGMSTGDFKRRSIFREYAGELSLDKGSLGEGTYEIHAYFEADPTDMRVQHITGVSKAFDIVPRI